MTRDVNHVLYQKTGVTISNVALSLLSKSAGDRIPPISYYQEEYGVSRGTIQNALNYLKEAGAIQLASHGHLGTYIEKIDYARLQENCLIHEMMGIMPLPYSLTYEGFATAIYEQLKNFKFNMTYARGAVGRIRLVESGTYQFAVCSRYAAEYAISQGQEIEEAIDFGEGSFLSKHVLLLRNSSYSGLRDGMKVAYDEDSLDQREITRNLIQGRDVRLVPIRTQQTLEALAAGTIDAGVWNYDDIIENNHLGNLQVKFLNEQEYSPKYSTALMVVRSGNTYLKEFLCKNISKEYTLMILDEVRRKVRTPFY